MNVEFNSWPVFWQRWKKTKNDGTEEISLIIPTLCIFGQKVLSPPSKASFLEDEVWESLGLNKGMPLSRWPQSENNDFRVLEISIIFPNGVGFQGYVSQHFIAIHRGFIRHSVQQEWNTQIQCDLIRMVPINTVTGDALVAPNMHLTPDWSTIGLKYVP